MKTIRLFKFLIISDEVINKSNMIRPIARVRVDHEKDKVDKVDKVIATKNEFYFFRRNLEESSYDNIVTQFDIKNSKSGIVLMSVDYPNEGAEFSKGNNAYVIIDAYNVDKVMDAIAPVEYQIRDSKNFRGCFIKDCINCTEFSKACKNKNISIPIASEEKYVRGTTWNFANDTVGTKNHEFFEVLDGIRYIRTIEPKTGGIVYSSMQWESGRPKEFRGKTIYVSLHHWIKCKSIPYARNLKGDTEYSFYHIGHTFDCRNKFVGVATLKYQKDLYKKHNPQKDIRRGRRVLAGKRYFSTSLDCKNECFKSLGGKLCYISNPKCRDCEGVLYINTREGLFDLYNQLMSKEYEQALAVDKTI